MATTTLPNPTDNPDASPNPTPRDDDLMRLTRVPKRFGRAPALRGADLALPRGSVVGLLGANGAGKTTLIRCALGLARPDAGTATVFGTPAWDLGEDAKARIGYVPQEPVLFPWMRGGDLLRYVSAFYPRWDAQLVRRLLSDWQVDPAARVGSMSPGTRQRLAIVLALAHEPELLVLDEPVAHLDPGGRREFLRAILAL